MVVDSPDPAESSYEDAMTQGEICGMAALFYENERPLRGMAGKLDWRFHGFASRCLREGILSGTPGECAYFPLPTPGGVRHVFLVGCGPLPEHAGRGRIPEESARALRENLDRLKLGPIGLSRSDLGDLSPTTLKTRFGTANLRLVR